MNFLGFLFRNWLSCVHDRDDLEQTVLKQLYNDYRELSVYRDRYDNSGSVTPKFSFKAGFYIMIAFWTFFCDCRNRRDRTETRSPIQEGFVS